MLKKLIHIFIFFAYWLCFTPSLVYFLYTQRLMQPNGIMQYFLQYTVLLFLLIVVYWLIHHIFDNCYMKHEIQRRVRKITMKRQFERFERGEITLEEAQHISTFTKPKSPKPKRRSPCPTRRVMKKSPAPPVKGDAQRKIQGSTESVLLQPTCSTTPSLSENATTIDVQSPPPPYSETVQNNDVLVEMNK